MRCEDLAMACSNTDIGLLILFRKANKTKYRIESFVINFIIKTFSLKIQHINYFTLTFFKVWDTTVPFPGTVKEAPL